jgi:hypothetical protein
LLPAVASCVALALPLAASAQEAECRSIIERAWPQPTWTPRCNMA